MKGTKPSNKRTLTRLAGVIRAHRRGDMSTSRALDAVEKIVREELLAEAREAAA